MCQTYELCTQKIIPCPLRSDMKKQSESGYYYYFWATLALEQLRLIVQSISSSRDRLTAFHGVSYRGWDQSTFSKLIFLFLTQLRIQKQVLECTSEDILVPSSCAFGTFEVVNPTCISWKPTMCMTECKVLVRISINRYWANKWNVLKEQEIISSA